MQKHYNYLDIDLDNKNNYRRLNAMQGDIKSRYILVNLYSNNLAYDLSNCTVKIYGLKRDKTIFFNNAVITNEKLGQFEIELTNQALAVPGELKIQILILGTNGEKLTSSAFFIDVGESIIDENAIESTNEFGALTESLTKVNEWNGYFEETSGKIEEKYTERLNNVDSQIKDIAINEVTETTLPFQVINFGGDKDYNIKKFDSNKKYINHVGGVLNGLSSSSEDYHNFLFEGENISINDLNFNCKSPHRAIYLGTSSNIEINNCSVNSASSGIVSDSTVKHVKIDNNDIVSENYGILFDKNCVNSEDVTISNNNIIAVADGIEINSPNEDQDIVLKNVKILNNTINQTTYSSDESAGLAIGIANTQGVICSNNYVKDAKNEGIHIEDCQQGVIVNSNIVNSSQHGIVILRNTKRDYNEGTVVCSNNFIKGKDIGDGIQLVLGSLANGNGSVETAILTNNVINSFGTGILLEGENSDTRYCSANLDGCVIEDCTTGLVTSRDVLGRVTMRNVDKCVEIKNGIVESITCNTPVVGRNVLTWNLKNLGYGCIKHINYKTLQFTTVNGDNKFELFNLGDYIKGNFLINLKIAGSGTSLKVFGSVDGDVITLNWTRKLKKSFGVFDDGNIVVEDGKLYFKFYSANANIVYSANIDFEGENVKVI